MKKRFINEPIGFSFQIFLLLIGVVLLFLSLQGPYKTSPSIHISLCITVFGSELVACVIWILMTTEIIIINEESIKRLKFSKKIITITIFEIKAITEDNNESGAEGATYPCWKIEDRSGNAIYIVQYKIRRKIIDSIQETINS
ncbi:MAG: hypothetical protein IJY18_00740 [Clostridia bacterium]|nr:hypothetical protein [Clostridia bacterium]